MSSRVIHLRRPATLSVVDEPFVPRDISLDEIERRWQEACRDNPTLYDGRLLHVIGVHRNGYGGAVLHVAPCSYRFHVVQATDLDLGVRPLGVKGITQHIQNDGILLGKRSRNVTYYPGEWEFAPGGVVEPDISPKHAIAEELREETGLTAAHDPVPVAVVYDDVIQCWEMVFHIVSHGDLRRAEDEYDALEWVNQNDLPESLSPAAREIATVLPRTDLK